MLHKINKMNLTLKISLSNIFDNINKGADISYLKETKVSLMLCKYNDEVSNISEKN